MTGILCNFTLWTLVAWGFTLSMLIALSRENQPVTLEDWIRAYTNGQTLETFTLDRLGVLFRFGLATYDNDRVIITAKVGFLVAQMTRLLRLFFGLKQ
ncbi:hypothetical protein [Crocosphaera watsonii]|uniref:Uncharacterized protein n=1 Tax=Crocosphaera watsonii WH 8502 TaxID=423474 RepID=T2I918_CROWT|nr:hypothetical protein [Crocosphaera watsonii]CCQ50016.1 hypothetical protein CWATWH8502_1804 [Crocosphaera watsonii WH 8502]